jgi:mitotic spindle assembly checkpoint protein MAD2
MSATDTKTVITLRGSVKIVSEFFFTAINSILYQRGIYQPETFRRDEKYGLTVLTTTDDGLLQYLNQVMGQMEQWLLHGHVQKLVVVVAGMDSGETLERWQFNVSVDDHDNHDGVDAISTNQDRTRAPENDENCPRDYNVSTIRKNLKEHQKSLKEIHNEIQSIIRQITASVSYIFFKTFMCAV